jgi:hypothetical protein
MDNGIETSLINTLFQGAGSKVFNWNSDVKQTSPAAVVSLPVNGTFRPIQYAKWIEGALTNYRCR